MGMLAGSGGGRRKTGKGRVTATLALLAGLLWLAELGLAELGVAELAVPAALAAERGQSPAEKPAGKVNPSRLPPAARPGHVTIVPPARLENGEPVALAAPRRAVQRESLAPLPPPRPPGFGAAVDGKTLAFGYHCDPVAAATVEPVAAAGWLGSGRCPEPVVVLVEFP